MSIERPDGIKNEILCVALSISAVNDRVEALVKEGLTLEKAFAQTTAEMRFGGATKWEKIKIADAIATGTRLKINNN